MGTSARPLAPMRAQGPYINGIWSYFEFNAPNPYVVGGIAIALPKGVGRIIGCVMAKCATNGRAWDWDGGLVTPKIKAYTAYPTTEAGAVDVSADGLIAGWLIGRG